jgi:hypothetical protein
VLAFEDSVYVCAFKSVLAPHVHVEVGPNRAITSRGRSMSAEAAPSVQAGTAPLELEKFYSDVATLVNCEMKVLAEDWTFLAEVNAMHAAKFSDLCKSADTVVGSVSDVKKTCSQLPTYFALVDELDSSLTVLEAAAVKLDQYSRALEKRFAPQ